MNEKIATGIAQTDQATPGLPGIVIADFCNVMAWLTGLERDDFDAVISELKRRAGVQFKKQLTGSADAKSGPDLQKFDNQFRDRCYR